MDSIHDQLHSILYFNDPSNFLEDLPSKLSNCSLDQAKEIISHLKSAIKSKKTPPTQKLQALKIICACMNSKNPNFISFCSKKLYNRFKIFGEYKKESNDIKRGSLLFNSDQRQQQLASEEFLVLLLRSIVEWKNKFGVDPKGKQTNYSKLFNYLESKNVAFPAPKSDRDIEILKQELANINKKVRDVMELITQDTDNERIRKIGRSLKSSYRLISDQIVKYMDLEDHILIKELNQSLEFLSNAQDAYESWKFRSLRCPVLNSPLLLYPPTCMFIKDVEPKDLPLGDNLSESIEEISLDEYSPHVTSTDRDLDEKEFTASIEWTGIGAEFCKLKDEVKKYEQISLNYQLEFEAVKKKYEDEVVFREKIEQELERVKVKKKNTENELVMKIEAAKQANKMYEEQIKNFKQNINELEEVLRKTLKENSFKTEQIKLLESQNDLLSNACKSLESEVEKYFVSEKMLKKEIKDLFKKIDRKTPEKDVSFVSSSSERIVANDDTLTRDAKISLLQKSEEEKSLPESRIQTDSIESEQTSLISPVPEELVKSKASKKIDQIDNLVLFKECLKRTRGSLLVSNNIKVQINLHAETNTGKAVLTIESCMECEALCLKTKLYSDPQDSLEISIDKELEDVLSKGASINRTLYFKCPELFKTFPLLKISFFAGEEKVRYLLLLPISYTLFCKKPEVDILKEWESIEEYREIVSKSEENSIKKIARNILFNKKFAYSYTEGNGVVIVTESPIGLALAVVILKDDQVLIQVKSKEMDLRELIANLIVTQLLTNTI